MRRAQHRESVSHAGPDTAICTTGATGASDGASPPTVGTALGVLRVEEERAAGADGMTWGMYAEGLEGRLADLHDRVHSGAYRATPSRRVIPKPGTRPLGVAAIEDKIVQKAVAEIILTARIMRSTRSRSGLTGVSWVVDCDIRAFFDNVSRSWVRFLEHRIGDKRVIRLIIKWLNAGVMEAGEWRDNLRGTPQGSVISPILANIYLHYVLDLWFRSGAATRSKATQSLCGTPMISWWVFSTSGTRSVFWMPKFGRFELDLHPDKTRLIEFGRAWKDRRQRGQGRPEIDFLGFTHYSKTRRGRFQLGRKPIAKRMSRTLKRIGARMHDNVEETAKWLGKVVDGWLNYYAVPTDRFLYRFLLRLTDVALNPVPQIAKGPLQVGRIARLEARHWPKLETRWPDQRFAVSAIGGATQGRSRVH